MFSKGTSNIWIIRNTCAPVVSMHYCGNSKAEPLSHPRHLRTAVPVADRCCEVVHEGEILSTLPEGCSSLNIGSLDF